VGEGGVVVIAVTRDNAISRLGMMQQAAAAAGAAGGGGGGTSRRGGADGIGAALDGTAAALFAVRTSRHAF